MGNKTLLKRDELSYSAVLEARLSRSHEGKYGDRYRTLP
jgi:hypothetical protein